MTHNIILLDGKAQHHKILKSPQINLQVQNNPTPTPNRTFLLLFSNKTILKYIKNIKYIK